jgi:hypothetical protein
MRSVSQRAVPLKEQCSIPSTTIIQEEVKKGQHTYSCGTAKIDESPLQVLGPPEDIPRLEIAMSKACLM